MSKHLVVWLDHKEARLISVLPDHADESTVSARAHNDHHHWTHEQKGLKEHPEDTKRFFHGIMLALKDAEELLIVGPGSAKLQFQRYLHEHDREIEAKVVGIETVDHPSDGQLTAYARSYFGRTDKAGLDLAP